MGTKKLTVEAVAKIRQLYDAGLVTQANLAKRFGVSQAVISKVVRREAWVRREAGR